MQTFTAKKTFFLLVFIFLIKNVAWGQPAEQRLHRADSLFVNASYIDALPLYESLLQRLQSASPAMLLRMAFIEEGAGNYTKALYYLNLYHLQIPNAAVALKMQELAARYNLLGYEFSDLDYFMIWYDRYYLYLAIGILLLNVCIFLIILLRKRKGKFVPIRHGGSFILLLAATLVLLNFRFNVTQAIVAQDNVYLMSAPSAASRLIKVIQKGNRLDIYEKQDIWLETEWNNQPAYVRAHNVLLVP
jgi:tetratricopeptide (TPR) repeat protein